MSGEETDEEQKQTSYPMGEIEDGAGCAEIWEELSKQRRDDD